jgi:hypothetical protein
VGTDSRRIKTPLFNGSTSYTVFRRQFEALVGRYKWASCAKPTHFLVALQGSATDVLHGDPKQVTYEEAIDTLEDCFRDQHLAATYRSQLKIRNHSIGESLQEFATSVQQSVHRNYPALPKYHVRREADRIMADSVGDINIQLLLGGEKTANQAVELQVVVLGARPQKTSANTLWGSRSPHRAERLPRTFLLALWVTFKRTSPMKLKKTSDVEKGWRRRPECSTPCMWRWGAHRTTVAKNPLQQYLTTRLLTVWGHRPY